jgi:disulfide bond formation protein DsbB
MTPFIENIIRLASGTVVVFDIGIVIFAIALFSKRFRRSDFLKFFSDNALLLSFIVALGATLGSFFFSWYVGFPPCEFCWYQRMFLFPQVFLFAFALEKKDSTILDYSLVLSIVGSLIALYHIYGQTFNTSALPCPAEGVSCAVKEFVEFGYVTIPVMSLTTFAILIFLALSRKLYRK